ncbi:MAG: hypothetical protein WAK96_08725 [Desulfobaccales bacterium]
MVRLKAAPNMGGVSYGGQEYPLVEGCLEVPEEAAQELLGFGWGFTLAGGAGVSPARLQPAPEAPQEGNGEPAPEEALPEGKTKR